MGVFNNNLSLWKALKDVIDPKNSNLTIEKEYQKWFDNDLNLFPVIKKLWFAMYRNTSTKAGNLLYLFTNIEIS